MVVSLVVGKRMTEATRVLVRDFRRVMRLMTSDDYPAYEDAIRDVHTAVPPEVTYATVYKEKENNRVVRVSTRVVFGTRDAVGRQPECVKTCLVERHDGTDRGRCRREVRRSYGFSKDREVHRAATRFRYNFCWPVRLFRTRDDGGRWPPGERVTCGPCRSG